MFLLATLETLHPSRKDVVVAALGATAALAGLVLVFLGVLVTSYQTLLGRVSEDTLTRFQHAAWLALALFFVGLVSIAVSTLWLLTDGGAALYGLAVALFFAELAGLAVVAAYSTWRVLLR